MLLLLALYFKCFVKKAKRYYDKKLEKRIKCWCGHSFLTHHIFCRIIEQPFLLYRVFIKKFIKNFLANLLAICPMHLNYILNYYFFANFGRITFVQPLKISKNLGEQPFLLRTVYGGDRDVWARLLGRERL